MEQQNKLDTVDPKYQQTLVYGIQCMTTGEMYVGSTHETLKERIRKHIQQRSCRVVQILNRGNYIPYEIQRWPCNTLREVLTLEGGWQRAYKASFPEHLVNKKIEGQFMNETPEVKKAYDDQPWTCELCNRTMRQNSRSRHKKKSCKFKPVVHEAQKGV
jgi:hypothetical protein